MRKFVKIVKSTQLIMLTLIWLEIFNSTKLILLLSIWLKFTKIVKSINIHFGRQNFVKSAIFITARISGHMQYIEEKLEVNNS